MKYRILLLLFGFFWLIFGLNNFLHFFLIPSPSESGAVFMTALEKTRYILPLVYAIQVMVGVLLIINCFVPATLLMLVPITSNILLYDMFLNPSGLVIGVIIAGIHGSLFYANRKIFMPLLKP